MAQEKELYEMIKRELARSEKQYKKLSASLGEKPNGSIHVLRREGKYDQYYLYAPGGKRTYLPVGQKAIAEKYAQYAYDEQILKILKKRIQYEKQLLKNLSTSIISVYDALPAGRKKLVHPSILDDESFIRCWYEKHPGNMNSYPFEKKIESERGEIMRSKSEVLIANLLYHKQIPYVYEAKLFFQNGHTVYPDFLILDVNRRKTIVLEHFGIMDQAGYAESMHEKLKLYQANGYWIGDQLIFTSETSSSPIDMKLVEKMIKKYLAC